MTTQGVGDPWVGYELRMVAKAGLPFRLHALRRPGATFFTAADIQELARTTSYIYPLSPAAAGLAFLAAPFRFRGKFWSALWNAMTGPRETFRIRLKAFGHLIVACHWAAALRETPVTHVHSQWIHSAGTVAMYGAWLLDKPFSFTGHAADLFRERAALEDKIRRAVFIGCISEFHREFFLGNGARPEQLHIVHCGIDTDLFTPRRRRRAEGEPFHILSAGRLVEKKGFDVLIRACALLKQRDFPFHCTIGGSGPLEAELRAQIAEARLNEVVTLTGEALKQEALPDFMARGDAFCLACVWAADNDVDGLPVMLMEAIACGLPAVSTRLVGIPDLIRHEETGLLVESGDAEGLADALQRLALDDDLARRLAEAGREHLVAEFDLDSCVEPLLDRYRLSMERG